MFVGMVEQEKNKLTQKIKLQKFRKMKIQEECANALKISIPTYKNLDDNPNKIDLGETFILSKLLDWNIFEFF